MNENKLYVRFRENAFGKTIRNLRRGYGSTNIERQVADAVAETEETL